MNKFTKGLIYIHQAYKFLKRDFMAAYNDRDWNIAVRRAQECVEFAVKGLTLVHGKEPSKVHSPLLPLEDIQKKPTVIGYQLKDDPKSATAVYVLRGDKHDNTIKLFRKENNIFTLIAQTDITEESVPFGLEIRDSAIKVLHGNKEMASSSGISRPMKGKWTQELLSKNQERLIKNYTNKLAKQRTAVFYYDSDSTETDAQIARDQAWTVLRLILKSLGLEI